MYDDAVDSLRKVIEAELSLIETVYNFEYGDEFEIAICNILRKFLPEKYGICRGFAVDKEGNKSQGDDIIIFDHSSFPTFFHRGNNNFSRLEKIPIESIYAYIECKHNLVLGSSSAESSLKKASKQVENFKTLCHTREPVLITQKDPYILLNSEIENAKKLPEDWWLPKRRNPIFGCIFSRKVSYDNSSKIIQDCEQVHNLLLQGREIEKNDNVVDLVVAGKHNMMSPSYFDNSGNRHECLFVLPDKKEFGLSCLKHENYALSMGIIHLLASIDWIRLGRINWESILNYYNKKNKGDSLL